MSENGTKREGQKDMGSESGAKHEDKKGEENAWDILDFTPAEESVIRTLTKEGTLSVSALARAARLPRSTANDALRRLSERRMVRQVAKGYFTSWRLVKPHVLGEEFTEAAESLGVLSEAEKHSRDMRDVFGVTISARSEVRVYRGVENVVKVYQNFMARSGIDRIYAIQTAAAARSWLEHVPARITHEVNEQIKKSGVVLEGVLTEDIKDVYRLFTKADPTWARVFGERPMQAIRLVPPAWLSGNMEFLISKHTVVLNNWPEMTIIVIEDDNVAAFLKNLYGFLFEAGKPFDQNAFVRELNK